MLLMLRTRSNNTPVMVVAHVAQATSHLPAEVEADPALTHIQDMDLVEDLPTVDQDLPQEAPLIDLLSNLSVSASLESIVDQHPLDPHLDHLVVHPLLTDLAELLAEVSITLTGIMESLPAHHMVALDLLMEAVEPLVVIRTAALMASHKARLTADKLRDHPPMASLPTQAMVPAADPLMVHLQDLHLTLPTEVFNLALALVTRDQHTLTISQPLLTRSHPTPGLPKLHIRPQEPTILSQLLEVMVIRSLRSHNTPHLPTIVTAALPLAISLRDSRSITLTRSDMTCQSRSNHHTRPQLSNLIT